MYNHNYKLVEQTINMALCWGKHFFVNTLQLHVNVKPTIHEATFVAGDVATLLFVRAAHEISNATFYKLLENRQPVCFQATCRMYHAIFPCAAHTNNNVAVSPATKVASCMVGSVYSQQCTGMNQDMLVACSMTM